MLKIRLNKPFDINPLKALFQHADDFKYLKPGATFPLEPREWTEVFEKTDSVSILVLKDDYLMGHFGFVAETKVRFRFVYFYLAPDFRGKGLAQATMDIAEAFAVQELGAKEICLNVQEQNAKAMRLYKNSGFQQISHSGTTVSMTKEARHRDQNQLNAETR